MQIVDLNYNRQTRFHLLNVEVVMPLREDRDETEKTQRGWISELPFHVSILVVAIRLIGEALVGFIRGI